MSTNGGEGNEGKQNDPLPQMRDHIKSLETDLRATKESKVELEKQLNELKTTIDELKSNSENKTEVEKLQSQIQELQGKVETSSKTIEELTVFKGKAEQLENTLKAEFEKELELIPADKRDAVKVLTEAPNIEASLAKLRAFKALMPVPVSTSTSSARFDSGIQPLNTRPPEAKIDLKDPSSFRPVLSKPTTENNLS